MFGNWATGSAKIVTAPMITVRIAMTMATMGRLMKNLDISLGLHERLHADFDSGTNLLGPLDNHALARFQPIADHPHRADSIANFDRLNAHRVFVVNDGHLIAALQLRDGWLRNK